MNLSPVTAVWIEFFVCAALIAAAGTRLSRYGDIIAEKTGLGGNWIGLLLMASVTSLPELVTGISAVTYADAPDIAVGNVLGACVINLAMLMVLDLLYRRESVYTRASQAHILSAGFGVMLAGFVGFNLLLAQYGSVYAVGSIGIYTPIIFVIYILALRTLLRYERRTSRADEQAARYPDMTLRDAVIRYSVAALVVVGAGIWLPSIGDRLATLMQWEQSFVGTLFIALATTLPEIAVTIGAVRIGALDLAIGNLFGSNLFNLAILAVDDLFFFEGPLFSHVASAHAVSALSVLMMSGVVIVGLFYRPTQRVFRTVGWTSLILLAIYLLNASFLYLYRG